MKTQNSIPLYHLKKGENGKITDIIGGMGLQKKLQVMGIRKGQNIKIAAKQPLRGPITISTGKFQMTLGRGMAHKIMVEKI